MLGGQHAAWLQTQNIPEHHHRELAELASDIPRALLYAVEHSTSSSQESARKSAIRALRAIPRTNAALIPVLVAEIRKWFCIVSRDVEWRENPEWERRRAERLISRIGADAPGTTTVLGVSLEIVDHSDWNLTTSAAAILEGFPLEGAIPVFEAAAIELAIRAQSPAWNGLKWLCLLNTNDPEQTTSALLALSEDVRRRPPERGVDPKLRARVAALVLWLTGREIDEDAATALDPGIDAPIDYEEDYLSDPATSLLRLERRHAAAVLLRSDLGLRHRYLRTKHYWLDPSFEIPAEFVKEVRAWAATVDVSQLDQHGSYTVEDHTFEEFEPVLARCDPDLLASLVQRKLRSNASCPESARYWRAMRGSRDFLLAGPEEAEAARELRTRSKQKDSREETIVANELLILELSDKAPLDQYSAIVEAGLEDVLVDLGRIVRAPSSEDVDSLVSRFDGGNENQQLHLSYLLALHHCALSDRAWAWAEERARKCTGVARGHAFRLLATCDPARFARTLLRWDWAWSEGDHLFTNHYGSGALIEAGASVPFEELAPRIAPWRLLEAVRKRSGDPEEVVLAAKILGRVLMDAGVNPPELQCSITVDSAHRESAPFTYQVDLLPDGEEDPFSVLKAIQDRDGHNRAYRHAVKAASARIDDACAKGAHLYLADVPADDMEVLLRASPEIIDEWVAGADSVTGEFRRKVRLAEGAYLGLCEALLRVHPERGEVLWRALRGALFMRHIGEARVDELLHVLFRVPASPPVERLRREVSELPACATDQALEDLAISATICGATDWLEQRFKMDKESASSLRRRRGVVFEGFRARNANTSEGASGEGWLRTVHAEVERAAALGRAREAGALVWWREYVRAPDAASAYAAWVLFLRAADRRAWIWMHEEMQQDQLGNELSRRKRIHADLNHSALRSAFEKSEDRRDSQFLMRDVVDSIGPWRTERMR